MVTFYTFLHHRKSNWLIVHEKISSGLIVRYFKENQLKDKYVTNKIEQV